MNFSATKGDVILEVISNELSPIEIDVFKIYGKSSGYAGEAPGV